MVAIRQIALRRFKLIGRPQGLEYPYCRALAPHPYLVQFEVDEIACARRSLLADDDRNLVVLGETLETGCQIHAVTQYRVIESRWRANIAGDNARRIHADADIGIWQLLSGKFAGQLTHALVDGERGEDGALRIIRSANGCAEQRHHTVAGIFVDHAVVLVDNRIDQSEVAIQ